MKRKTRLRHKRRKVDLTDWGLETEEFLKQIDDAIHKAAAVAIECAMEDGDTGVWFPVMYGNEEVIDDPLTMTFSLAVAPEGNPVEYSFSPREEVLSLIGDCRKDGSWAEGLSRLSNALRELADQIDAGLPADRSTWKSEG